MTQEELQINQFLDLVKDGNYRNSLLFNNFGFKWITMKILAGLLLFFLISSEPVLAKTVGQGFVHRQDLEFSAQKTRMIANRIAGRLLSQEPFKSADLPVLVALQLLRQKIPGKVSDRQFTDQVLNAVLFTDGKTFVVNQEPNVETSKDFGLVSYDDSWLTRKRGQLMGANYYISGQLSERVTMNEKGKLVREYEAILELKDIETDELVSKSTIYTHRKTLSKK